MVSYILLFSFINYHPSCSLCLLTPMCDNISKNIQTGTPSTERGGGRDRVGEKAKIRVQKIPWTIDEKTVKTGI